MCILLTVFQVSKDLALGIVSEKYFWFYISIGCVAVTAVGVVAIWKKKIQFGLTDGIILLFISISSIFISDMITTKRVLFTLIIILYFYFRLVFQTNKYTIFWFIVCFVFTGLAEAIWGLKQLYGFEKSQHGLFQLTGSFFNPGPYACYVASVLPMAFFYVLKYRICYKIKFHFRDIPIYFLWGISLLTSISSILVLPAAMSRASWIAAIGGCGLVLICFLVKNRNIKTFMTANKKKCVLLVAIAIPLMAAGGFGMYQIKKDSADGRALIWKNSLELIKQNPKGVGIGNFSGSYGHIQTAYFEAGYGSEKEKRVADNPEYAFNEYLQICAEQGIVVFLIFACIIGYSLYIGFRRKKTAITASLFALLIAAGASYPFSVLPFLIVFVFLLALINNEEKGVTIPKIISVTFTFCCLIIVSLCLFNRYPTYNAYKKWNKVSLWYNSGYYKEAVDEYRSIYPLLCDQIQFLFEYAQCLSNVKQYKESNEIFGNAIKISCDPMLYNIMGKNFQALKQYQEAERCFCKSSNIVPNRIYPYYLLALMYMDAGETEKAKAAAQTVLIKEPKVQSVAICEMKTKMKNLIDDN
jgi:tetratricopeptide (TPR) repeat protein